MQGNPQDASARAPFEAVVLVASAGGLEAFIQTLQKIPGSLPAAVIVAQHLSDRGSALVQILSRCCDLPVFTLKAGEPLLLGRVYVAPARRRVELRKDLTFLLHSNERGATELPLDFLLQSVAESLGSRALVVVLSGMGRDAAAGALAVRQAGGAVIVQSEETAGHSSMPHASIRNGAASLVLPLSEIGRAVVEIVFGHRNPY